MTSQLCSSLGVLELQLQLGLSRDFIPVRLRERHPMHSHLRHRVKSSRSTLLMSYVLRPLYLFASISPLTAAVIAPLAVLLDIPALTEKWYTRNGQPQPDPRASLILSGLSLSFSLVANALLVIRFSLEGRRWMIATQISVACWIVKVVVGITNLVVFGALTRNQPQFSYAEGFWSAVVSVIASGIVLALLLLHWMLEFKRDPSQDDQPSTPAHTKVQIRVAGRHFMLQNTMLIALIALTSLIFSRIISQMRAENPSLQREIAFLRELHEHQGWREQGVDLAQSLIGFLILARWRCYIWCRGTPISPAGRVIFIVYSIIAVPIMASFAVQAVQNILERLSNRRMDQRRARFGDETSQATGETQLKNDPENNPSNEPIDEMHSTLVTRFHSGTTDVKSNTDVAMNTNDLKKLLEHAVSLERVARRLLVAHLEEGSPAQILLRADWNLQSRDLRILQSETKENNSSYPEVGAESNGDPESDRTYRNKAHGITVTEAGMTGAPQSREEEEEAEIAATAVGGMGDEETLKAVREFRRNVAGVLALGSRLRELEGMEKYIFERRRQK
ncbi:hypothetical protein RhiXN_10802 [Rhizoctonia solani]|uniref:Uncharacterized protein n=1 Tax=Rhizoctonia solani TaxID=456999 RepID=A0A8H8P704_9AGAM|nr:uncharacterized protein RhiXN_10802 [Rhizoctonia solani]QRW25725.1 hypothetical protein RhiXN_10802 [Rhizoctonia solani]